MPKYHIMVVDDELPNLESLERILKSEGAVISLFQDPHAALQNLRKQSVDVLLTDLRMRSMSGLELLEACKTVDPTVEVVLMTAYGTVELAVEAMKKGAYDFITKPLQRLVVLKTIERALEKRRLVHENSWLKEELNLHGSSSMFSRDLVWKSDAMRLVMEIAQAAARSRANVLIEGESGTGKGVLARYLHYSPEKPAGLFVTINCTAIPESLLEAELFGFEAGAFTGAMKRKKGRVELAQGGTLFLDEIGIAPHTFQSKLLRFLQDGEFERLGGNETYKVDTRVISATNADMKQAIAGGRLREDLYYRLNVIHIRLPALRERKEDIPLLAKKFLEESAKKNGRAAPLLHPDALEGLVDYLWPGNIRELQNLIERMVVLNRSGVIERSDLPTEIVGREVRRKLTIPIGIPLREVEKILMDETLRTTKGDKKLAAKLLGVHPRTIYRHLESCEPLEPIPDENVAIAPAVR